MKLKGTKEGSENNLGEDDRIRKRGQEGRKREMKCIEVH